MSNKKNQLPTLASQLPASTVDERLMGPKMLALVPRQRLFVLALLGQEEVNFTAAARTAGYSQESPGGIRIYASTLARDTRVLEAIEEETERRIKSVMPFAVDVLERIMMMPQHKDQLRAAKEILDRGGLGPIAKSQHQITVGGILGDPAMLQKIDDFANKLGIDLASLVGARVAKTMDMPTVTDVEYEEAPASLEDLI